MAAIPFAGCGGSGDGPKTTAQVEDRPAPPASEFPSAEGKTLREVLESADVSANEAKIVASPASMVFNPGKNRYSFGVFTQERDQIPDADVALYFARVPPEQQGVPLGSPDAPATEESLARALDQAAIGPFTARVDSLETEAAFRARTTTEDPDAALAIYVTELSFPKPGEWRVAALIRRGDEVAATLLPSANVGQFDRVPQPGDRAPLIHTPTPEDVGGDLSKIDTRLPPSTQHEVDFADVVGEKPIVLLFATPQFCQSRVCGPVVDVAEQVKRDFGDKAEFIHMEIFNNNDPNQGVRPQLRTYNLPDEPWVFVIDASGVIHAAIEGAFSVGELTKAVEEVTG